MVKFLFVVTSLSALFLSSCGLDQQEAAFEIEERSFSLQSEGDDIGSLEAAAAQTGDAAPGDDTSNDTGSTTSGNTGGDTDTGTGNDTDTGSGDDTDTDSGDDTDTDTGGDTDVYGSGDEGNESGDPAPSTDTDTGSTDEPKGSDGGSGSSDNGGSTSDGGDNTGTDTGDSGDNTADNNNDSGSSSDSGNSDNGDTGSGDDDGDNTASNDNNDSSSDDGDDADDDPRPSAKDIAACAKENGTTVDQIKVSGNKRNEAIDVTQVAAYKITGNQSTVTINLKGGAGNAIKGLCIFAAGNKAKVRVNVVDVTLGKLWVKARGNQANIEVNVLTSAEIKLLEGDLSGNQSGLSIAGDGKYPCETVWQKGRGSSFTCQ